MIKIDYNLYFTHLQGDACEKVMSFETGSFNFIIHDPPARALSRTDIYGLEFYSQLRRVLSNDGSLFHYIGTNISKMLCDTLAVQKIFWIDLFFI